MLVLATFFVMAASAETAVTLRVKPMLCITDRRDTSCEMSFVVHWASDVAGHYCLHSDVSVVPLKCWDEQSSGRFEEHRVVFRSFSYWLTLRNAEMRLAEGKVEVMSAVSSDRRRNRHRRHAWSVL